MIPLKIVPVSLFQKIMYKASLKVFEAIKKKEAREAKQD